METKRNYFLLITLMVFTVLIGCSSRYGGSDIVTPPPPVVKAPTITVSYNTGEISYGGRTNIVWETKTFNDPTVEVTLDGNAVALSGSFDTDYLYENAKFVLVAQGKNGTDRKEVNITVGDWTTSLIGQLSHEPESWDPVAAGYKVPSTMDDFVMYSDEVFSGTPWATQEWYFTTSLEWILFEGGTLVGTKSFVLSISDNTIQIVNGTLFDIESITLGSSGDPDVLVLIGHITEDYDSNGDGNVDSTRPALFKWVLERNN